MSNYYLAVDIGASSGRHILGHVENGKVVLEEIYRFENGMDEKNGSLCWDVERLFHEIIEGMKVCANINKIPVSMGIDTWAVDYVLLDARGKILGETYGYRDNRTEGMDEEVYKFISEKELYNRTGIQKQIFNTIYQLMEVKRNHPEYLEMAQAFLMLPDYFHYQLTGVKVSDYTNATSTQLVNATTQDWDDALIEKLGYPRKIFLPLSMPGSTVGEMTQEMQKLVGYNCKVVLPATHDTASAVMAVPSASEDTLYISSGTWSLMGVENSNPICTEESRNHNFTNEGGYGYRYRYLKNIMGLWMIQSVRHELDDAYSFAQLCELAEEANAFPSRVDVNAAEFLSPDSMMEQIKTYCKRTKQVVPETVGELAAVIYQSLADSYAHTVDELEQITGKHYETIHIVGGGSNAAYLNQLTAEKSGRCVQAGPSEATAIGNLAAQLLSEHVFEDLKAVRKAIFDSFEIKTYHALYREDENV